jgi:hypothetical protein
MTNSKMVAQLVGPALLALSVSEALNLRIWAVNIPAVMYLNGAVLFVAGLAIVRVHNRWTRGWTLLLTLVGWGAILLGLFRMFAPRLHTGGANLPTYSTLAILFVLGACVSIKGYSREQS